MIAHSAFGAAAGLAGDGGQIRQKLAPDARLAPMIVFGGEGGYVRQNCRIVGLQELQGLGWPVITSILELKTLWMMRKQLLI